MPILHKLYMYFVRSVDIMLSHAYLLVVITGTNMLGLNSFDDRVTVNEINSFKWIAVAYMWRGTSPQRWLPGTPFINMELLKSQHEWVITCPVKCERKLLIHSQTLTVAPMMFGNGQVISSHTLWYTFLLIHAEIKVNPCLQKGPLWPLLLTRFNFNPSMDK